MPPKRKSAVKVALRRVEDGLRRLFRGRDHIPPATEPNPMYMNNTAWDGLERFNGILKTNGGVFGPLTSAMDQFSGCIKMFEEQARAREEYKKIGVDLNDLFHTLAGHFEQVDPASVILDSFAHLARGIDAETKLLESDKHREPRDDGATQDVDKTLRCYRRVRTLLALFAANETAKMWKVDDDEALNTRLELLLHSPNAHYRAAYSKDVRRTGCTPNTRIDILQELRDWVHYGKFQKVYWLSGVAGTGKTTIAYSLCDWLENSGKPAASFFYSRDTPECRDVKRILPSVAYQLARLSRPFRFAISNALEQDPELCNRPVDEQFKRLIAAPFQSVGHTFGVDVVIVLDALDECEDKDGVNLLLGACFKDSVSLPVRFLITSRQNPWILDRMRASQGGGRRSELRLNEVDRIVAQRDVRIYLSAGLGRFGMPDGDLERLAKRSVGSFIYAASVVKYLGQGNVSARAERLKRLLDTSPFSEDTNNRDMDMMYAAILEEALDQDGLDEPRKAEIMLVLRTAACARDAPTLNFGIAELLGLDFVSLMNTSLHLLLPALQVSGASGLGITLYESFSAFLLDPQRSGKFHCDGPWVNGLLAQFCLDLIRGISQPFNICNLDSSYLLDREVVDIDERVKEAIPEGLWYASRHWGTHLALAEPSDKLLAALHDFLSRRLLVWMEIINLKQSMPEVAEELHGVQVWLQEVECPVAIRDLVLDAWKFVAEFSSSVVSESTPHIYVSALRFWPAHRPVSMHYTQMLRNVVKAIGARPRSRGEGSMDLDGPVTRIVQSSQGFNIIAGVAGNNPHHVTVGTGQSVDRPIEGHTRSVISVAYSPDGAYIASGHYRETIRIWDAQTGQPVSQPLNGHTGMVLSVAYSPDGAYIASSSQDKTVRIWDARTGQPVGQPLNGHTGWVRSVAYSPDGAYIASGSDDSTIRIWDAQTGQPVGQPLNGHITGVNSVAYSPDGAYIASGSADMTVRIWDTQTGQPVGRPLNGHRLTIYSVAYSPDGAYIASGSYDKTVRIWDAQTGQPVGQPLIGHTGDVYSVAYSPDGAYIVSGSDDETVRIWDAQTGQPVGQPLIGHTGEVYSVAYSPDGAYISSGSDDNTVRIWDSRAAHGAQPPAPLSPPIRSSAHSPNRSIISSVFSRFITHAPRLPVPAIASSHIPTCTCTPLINPNLLTHSLCTSLRRSPHSTSTAEELLRRWILDDQGWVVNTRQERLIWVPQDLREFLLVPPALNIIPLGDHLMLDFRDATIGAEWRDCSDPTQLYAA